MNNGELLEKINEFIAKDEIQKVFPLLDVWNSRIISKESTGLTLLKNRYSTIRKEHFLGLIKDEDYRLEKNKIIFAILNLLKEFKLNPKDKANENNG